MRSLIEELVHRHLPKQSELLDGSWCHVGSDVLRLDVDEAIAHMPLALEHRIGERPLAFFSLEEHYPESFNAFLLFTDRRIMGRFPRLNGTFGEVHLRYAHLRGTQRRKGILTDELRVIHANQTYELKLGTFNDKLQVFLDAVCAIPSEQREPAPYPMMQTSGEDPIGTRHAVYTLMDADERARFLFEYVERAHEQGSIPTPAAIDLTARLTLQHRNEACGRGVDDGSFMSALGRDDLSNVLVALYGKPLAHAEQPRRTLTFDARNMETNVLDGIATLANGADVAEHLLTLNVGALAGSAKDALFVPRDIHVFTIAIVECGPYSLFRLFDRQTPLSVAAPHLAFDVCRTIDRLEAALLLRRCAYGWAPSAGALLTAPSSEIIERFAAVMGPFDAHVLARAEENRS